MPYRSGIKMAENSKIAFTKDSKIAEVLKVKPVTAGVFFSLGMPCLGCVVALNESIEAAAMAHGIDLDELLKRLNEA
jgi:hybrid cluster-associated redox disulfide protein